MTIVSKLLLLALIGLAGWFVTHRALPRLFVRAGRMLGLRMQLRPLTRKRVQRFKAIRRGYICFVIITTAFVTSLFLELYVNNKPLLIRSDLRVELPEAGGLTAWLRLDGYQPAPRTQLPAVMSWLNAWVPEWVPGAPFIDEARRRDYGLEGAAEVDYRTFARWVRDPAELEADARRIERRIAEDEQRLRQVMARNAAEQGLPYDPDEPLPEAIRAGSEARLSEAEKLRALRPAFETGRLSIVMPVIPYSALEQIRELPGQAPHKTFLAWRGEAAEAAAITEGGDAEGADAVDDLQPRLPPLLGTDYAGRDVLAQLLYGFRTSFFFAIFVAFVGYAIGVTVGGVMGYFGGWIDIIVQRGIEIWSAIPFLFMIMIIAAAMQPGFWGLAALLIIFQAWIAITFTIRGEFYREKARDYVQAASAIGLGHGGIMGRHILPNSLVPVVSFLPFQIVGNINALVMLDYLGFGLPPEMPSWGRLLREGAENVMNHPHLVAAPVIAFAGTLFCVVLIGEAVREAFDPKKYSRLR